MRKLLECLFVVCLSVSSVECEVCMCVVSDAYTMDGMVFRWGGEESVSLDQTINLPQFDLTNLSYFYCTRVYSTGPSPFPHPPFPLSPDTPLLPPVMYIKWSFIGYFNWSFKISLVFTRQTQTIFICMILFNLIKRICKHQNHRF